MEIHNILNKVKKYFFNERHLIDTSNEEKEIKKFLLIDNLKKKFSDCDETEDILCQYYYVVNTPCADTKTKSCDYSVTQTSGTYNTGTEVLTGYVEITGNILTTEVAMKIVKNNVSSNLTFTIQTINDTTKRLNFTTNIAILDYFNNGYTIEVILETQDCYSKTTITKAPALEVNKRTGWNNLAGKVDDSNPGYNFIIDIPVTVVNNASWNVKNCVVIIDATSRANTTGVFTNNSYPSGSVTYIRITIPYADMELVSTNPTALVTISLGYQNNSAIIDTIEQSVLIDTSVPFYGYSAV